jgi:hypothetical protein
VNGNIHTMFAAPADTTAARIGNSSDPKAAAGSYTSRLAAMLAAGAADIAPVI